jgi:hypothetical protein
LFTKRQAVNVKVVGETERVGGTGVAVGAAVGAEAAGWVGEPFDPVPPPGGAPAGVCGVAAGVCDIAAAVDVPLAVAVPPAEEELDDASDDALAFDDVNGETMIERGLRWVMA